MSEEPPPKSMEVTPGPNKYMLPTLLGQDKHDPRKRIQPAYTMQGRRHPDRVVDQPAPNKFQTANLTRYGHEATGKIEPTMKGRFPPTTVQPSPGPGNYDTAIADDITLNQAPAYSLGGRIKSVPPTASFPGPNNYSLPTFINGTGYVSTGKSSPAFQLLSRVPETGLNETRPGPLNYGATPPEMYKSKYAPQITLTGRPSRKEALNGGPGPNMYNSLVYPIGKSGPSFSMSSRHRPRVGIMRTEADNAPAYFICDSG